MTGAIWQIKGYAPELQQIRIEAELRRQELTTHFCGQGKRSSELGVVILGMQVLKRIGRPEDVADVVAFLGLGLSQRKIQKLISKSRITTCATVASITMYRPGVCSG